jgi:hypothetical protein
MPRTDSREIDTFLAMWAEGDTEALRSFLLYDELPRVARQPRRRPPSPRSQQTNGSRPRGLGAPATTGPGTIPEQVTFHRVRFADAANPGWLRA